MKVIPAFRRWWDWPAALLFFIAMMTAAARLVVTEWTTILSVVQSVAFFGVLAGLAIGVSRFSPRTAFWLAFDYGIFVTGWQIGSAVAVESDMTELLWSDRMMVIARRLGVIIYQLINRQQVMDSLLFVVLMSALFWVLAVYGGYSLSRYGDAWRAVLPAGLALLVIQYYDPLIARRAWYLAFFIFFALTLVARMAFVQSQARWRDTHTSLPPHLSLDFIRYTALVASLLVVLSWTAPAMANALPAAERMFRPVKNLWNEAQGRMNYAFASLRSTTQVYSPVYGNNASLGQGSQLSNVPMFTAHTPSDLPTGARLYWRARHFDEYRDGQWYSNILALHNFDPNNANFTVPQGLGRWVGEFDIVSAVVMGTMFTPSQPLWVDHTGTVQYEDNGDGTVDVASFVSSPTILPSEGYRVSASLAAPTIEQMRIAGTDYPPYITERYLQLPADITPRTRQLAEDITAGLETPYDKANAITNWLRSNIEYVQVIETPIPSGREPVDWFLFDLKKGFCNYYATAEIVMLRSLGIPARWSVGYAQGELAQTDQRENATGDTRPTYIVRQKDAHAWPEVYFPTIGWVEFEPTAAQPEIARLENRDIIRPETSLGNVNQPSSVQREPEEREPVAPTPTGPQVTWQQVLGAVAAGLLGVALLLFVIAKSLPLLGLPAASILIERLLLRLGVRPPQAVSRRARIAEAAPRPNLPPLPVMLETAVRKLGLRPPRLLRQWSRHAQLPPIAQAYTEINRSLGRIGHPPAPDLTPQQRAEALAIALPPTRVPAGALAQEYQASIYGRCEPNVEIARQSAKELRIASFKAFFKRFLARFQAEERRELRGGVRRK